MGHVKSLPPGGVNSLVRLRSIAAQILAQVFHSSLSLDQAMLEVMSRHYSKTLPDFDRAWIFELCSGVLRFKGRIDYLIDTYSLKKKPSGLIRRYLMTAVFQLLEQSVAPALVVSETVDAIRESEGDFPAKFANAILRKIADSREAWREWRVSAVTPQKELIAWSSLPEWLFKKLVKEKGLSFTLAFAESGLKRPVTWYRNLESGQAQILENGFRGDEPRGYVQDISNQELVSAVLDLLNERIKMGLLNDHPKVLDLCAAPGGKSLGLALGGFSVIATDIDESRLQKVIENKTRLQLAEKIEVVPFETVLKNEVKYEVIWIDAPCMSTGIIRRHPEIKWNRSEKDLSGLVSKQRELVAWAKSHLSENGVLIYSTCSLLKAENEHPSASLQVLGTFERYPHEPPFGDAMVASFLTVRPSA